LRSRPDRRSSWRVYRQTARRLLYGVRCGGYAALMGVFSPRGFFPSGFFPLRVFSPQGTPETKKPREDTCWKQSPRKYSSYTRVLICLLDVTPSSPRIDMNMKRVVEITNYGASPTIIALITLWDEASIVCFRFAIVCLTVEMIKQVSGPVLFTAAMDSLETNAMFFADDVSDMIKEIYRSIQISLLYNIWKTRLSAHIQRRIAIVHEHQPVVKSPPAQRNTIG
jgi:hypothetical protein